MDDETLLNYRLGYDYVLGTFNPALFLNCYVSLEGVAPYLHEFNHLDICANSLVHKEAPRQALLSAFPGETPDYSIVDNFRSLFEGIVKACAELSPDYREEEEGLLANLEKVLGARPTPLRDPERDKISHELVAVTKEFNKEQKFKPEVICGYIGSALINCVHANSNIPDFDDAIRILWDLVAHLDIPDILAELPFRITSKMIRVRPSHMEVHNPGEIHAAMWNALELLSYALAACVHAQDSLPLMKSLSPLLNFVVPGSVFPEILVRPIEGRHSIQIHINRPRLENTNKILKNYRDRCSLARFKSEFIGDILSSELEDSHKAFEHICDAFWNFLIEVERFWPTQVYVEKIEELPSIDEYPKCDCGMPLMPYIRPVQGLVLENLEACKVIFNEAKGAYLEWFKSLARGEIERFLTQFVLP